MDHLNNIFNSSYLFPERSAIFCAFSAAGPFLSLAVRVQSKHFGLDSPQARILHLTLVIVVCVSSVWVGRSPLPAFPPSSPARLSLVHPLAPYPTCVSFPSLSRSTGLAFVSSHVSLCPGCSSQTLTFPELFRLLELCFVCYVVSFAWMSLQTLFLSHAALPFFILLLFPSALSESVCALQCSSFFSSALVFRGL